MICRTTLALGAMALVSLASSAAMAQNAPPPYEGDPDVYKVIFEDQNFRVIDSVRKKGVHDKLHSHPVPSIVYHLTDCTSLLYGPDGKPTASPTNGKAGTAFAVPSSPRTPLRTSVPRTVTRFSSSGNRRQVFLRKK